METNPGKDDVSVGHLLTLPLLAPLLISHRQTSSCIYLAKEKKGGEGEGGHTHRNTLQMIVFFFFCFFYFLLLSANYQDKQAWKDS